VNAPNAGLAKYDLEEMKLSRVEINGRIPGTTAMDEDYLYWDTRTTIYRKRKF
jgi:hypothetical protein